MLRLICIIFIFTYIMVRSAAADPIIDMRDKFQTACTAAIKANAKSATPKKTVKLGMRTILHEFKKTFDYRETMDQAYLNPDDVLICRMTQPGSKCDKNPRLQRSPVSQYYDESVLFAKDESARRIRRAMLRFLSEAITQDDFNSDYGSSKPRKFSETTVQLVWHPGVCTPSGDCPTIEDDPSEKLFSLGRPPLYSRELFRLHSRRLIDFIDQKDTADVICVPGAKREQNRNLVDRALEPLDYVTVMGASIPNTIIYNRNEALDPSVLFADTRDPVEGEGNQFKRSFRILKDPAQFAATDPKGFELGTDISSDGSTSDFTVDIAMGLTFARDDKSTKAVYPGKTGVGTPGHKRRYSIYTAYAQSPSNETVFDRSVLQLPLDPPGEIPTGPITIEDRNFAIKEQPYADGVLRAGLRVDYEFVPWFERPRFGGQWWDRPSGIRTLGSKSSFTLETLTDNQLDLQANRFESTWTPPSFVFANWVGFRHPLSFFEEQLNVEFEWTANTFLDGLTYARTPLDRDETNDREREDLSDFIRLGYDAEFELRGALPFGIPGDESVWSIGYETYTYEDLSGGEGDASGDTVTIGLEDIWESNWKLSLAYTNAINPITFKDSEVVKLGVELKLDGK